MGKISFQALPPCTNNPRYSFRNRVIYFSWLRFTTRIRNQEIKMEVAPTIKFLEAFKSRESIIESSSTQPSSFGNLWRLGGDKLHWTIQT